MVYTRTNIYLSGAHMESIKKIANERGIKFSELIRNIMAEYIKSQEK
jgi:predicted DNA binding CopG/RHH family protein